MKKRRFFYKDFKEDYSIDFEKDEVIKERVLNNKYEKIYTLKDISRWVEYGLRNGVVNQTDMEGVMDWIDLLDGKNIQL